ncbi:MAG: arylesterase [Verrucomicrobia bacterium]|nr:arylesterase [Verrucomicrobiota bacterium]MCG2681384.1 arylesterase [Kiritimatiellia bacterium]MBU4248161.1 arylesterase [Verrucomicrobiota bacterium]MBU4291800.1 arylesterase [Verrucomicrobiota bacterium]MBU4427814.1 arylesterase [Verrucomicrobiota bacterium]
MKHQRNNIPYSATSAPGAKWPLAAGGGDGAFFILPSALSLILAGLLAACGPRVPSVTPLAPEARILAFGDSLTWGIGAERDASYPAILEQLIGRKVINAGVPGEVTPQGLARLTAVLEQHQPALMILCHGGNDLLQKTGEQEADDNLRAMIRRAREHQVDVVLIGVPRPGLLLSPPKYYPQIAREFGIPYEGTILSDILSRSGLKSDAIHPNAEGYRKLAEAIAQLLRQAKAVP